MLDALAQAAAEHVVRVDFAEPLADTRKLLKLVEPHTTDRERKNAGFPIVAIAGLVRGARRSPAGGAGHRGIAEPVAIRVGVPRGGGRGVQVDVGVVDEAVAIVVPPVAHLDRIGPDVGSLVIAIGRRDDTIAVEVQNWRRRDRRGRRFAAPERERGHADPSFQQRAACGHRCPAWPQIQPNVRAGTESAFERAAEFLQARLPALVGGLADDFIIPRRGRRRHRHPRLVAVARHRERHPRRGVRTAAAMVEGQLDLPNGADLVKEPALLHAAFGALVDEHDQAAVPGVDPGFGGPPLRHALTGGQRAPDIARSRRDAYLLTNRSHQTPAADHVFEPFQTLENVRAFWMATIAKNTAPMYAPIRYIPTAPSAPSSAPTAPATAMATTGPTVS